MVVESAANFDPPTPSPTLSAAPRTLSGASYRNQDYLTRMLPGRRHARLSRTPPTHSVTHAVPHGRAFSMLFQLMLLVMPINDVDGHSVDAALVRTVGVVVFDFVGIDDHAFKDAVDVIDSIVVVVVKAVVVFRSRPLPFVVFG